jgi:hypothetical protein
MVCAPEKEKQKVTLRNIKIPAKYISHPGHMSEQSLPIYLLWVRAMRHGLRLDIPLALRRTVSSLELDGGQGGVHPRSATRIPRQVANRSAQDARMAVPKEIRCTDWPAVRLCDLSRICAAICQKMVKVFPANPKSPQVRATASVTHLLSVA